ncbi:hypothetical protein, partial [Stenotrophomonas maltophilia]|uniref:hypothetical protein n=1 Tax=Stenotrophomonas maltophilia TaxID=40324 RepID=UPI0013D9EC1B
MSTIAANTTTGDAPAWLRSGSAANPAAPAGKSGANPSTAGGNAGDPAVSVVLSDQAKARLKQLQAGLPISQDQSASLDAMVQK